MCPSEKARHVFRRTFGLLLSLSITALVVGTPSAEGQAIRNPFHDPVLQITRGMPSCPQPEEPMYTEQEYIALAHERSQRGVSCWLAGRCRLSNGYLYDAEIVPRIDIAVHQTSAYDQTSVWALGQRRRVWLRGCVQTERQSKELEAIVRNIDDVEDVQNELMVGDHGVPAYLVRKP
jgi:hypothetical protein